MECLTAKEKINYTFRQVSESSYQEKRHFFDEQAINIFLDNILKLKSLLGDKTAKLNILNENLERLTWIDDTIDEECLKMLNDLIAGSKDLHSSLIRTYVRLNFFRQKGIAKEEIKQYKLAIDDLKEIYTDLESVFFFLPQMPEFKEISKEISLL